MPLHPFTVSLRHETHVAADAWTLAVYAVVAIGTALLTRRRPALGIAALIVLAPLGLARYIGPTTMTLEKAGVIGLVVALLLRRSRLAAFSTQAVRVVSLSFLATFAATVASGMHADHLDVVVRETGKLVEYAVLFLTAMMAFASDPDDRPFWRGVEVSTFIVCVSAVAEYAIGAHSGILFHGTSVPRIAGFLEGPNQLAGWLEIVTPILLARAMVNRDRFLVALVVFAFVVDVLTFSRAGIIALVFGSAIVLSVMRGPRRTVVGAVLAALVAVVAGTGYALRGALPLGYFSLDQAPQVADHLANRAELYRAAIALWHRSPVFGVGAGNYELELASVGLPNVRTHANSLYLQALAEGGLLLATAIVLQIAGVLTTLGTSGIRRPLIVGTFAAVAALALHQIFDDLVFFTKVGSTYWLIIGVAVGEIAAQRLFERRVPIEPGVAA